MDSAFLLLKHIQILRKTSNFSISDENFCMCTKHFASHCMQQIGNVLITSGLYSGTSSLRERNHIVNWEERTDTSSLSTVWNPILSYVPLGS